MKILLATTRYPWPPRRGNQLRTLQMAEWLATAHEVTVLAPQPGRAEPAPPARLPFRLELHSSGAGWAPLGVARAALSGAPLQNGLYAGPAMRRRLAVLASAADLVILQLVRLAGALPAVGRTPVAVDCIDSLALNFERRAQFDRWWVRPFLRAEARRLRRAELRLLRHCDAGWVVCERDRAAIAESADKLSAAKLEVLPVAVAPAVPRTGGGESDERQSAPSVVLTGNLGYFPTLEGALWFLRSAWPAVRARSPRAQLIVAGARPPGTLRGAVARAGGQLIDEPADLGAILAGATVTVAPLRCGSGLPIKVLEAWGAGVPVVVTPYAAAGTTGVVGQDFLLAEDPADWAAAVGRLLDEPGLRRDLTRSGRARLLADFGEEHLRGRLLASVDLRRRAR